MALCFSRYGDRFTVAVWGDAVSFPEGPDKVADARGPDAEGDIGDLAAGRRQQVFRLAQTVVDEIADGRFVQELTEEDAAGAFADAARGRSLYFRKHLGRERRRGLLDQ